MTSYVTADLRRLVVARAEALCEYCVFCNRGKGTDLGSIAGSSGNFVRFFNPRVDRWFDHFRIAGARIEPVTETGEVTVRILDFNSAERLLEREALCRVGRFPSPEALARLRSRPCMVE